MRKIIAIALCLAMVLCCAVSLGEEAAAEKTTVGTISINGAFTLKCDLPEGYKITPVKGSRDQVTELTQAIIERVYGKTYQETFTIKIETECPKQITCRGGVKLENQRLEKTVNAEDYSSRKVNAIKYCYSMLDNEPLTYEQWQTIAKVKNAYGDWRYDSKLVGIDCAHLLVSEVASELGKSGRQ